MDLPSSASRDSHSYLFFWSVVSGPDFSTRLINLSVSRIADLPLTLTSSWTLRLFSRRFLGTIRSFSVLSAIKGHGLKPTTLLSEKFSKTRRRLRCVTQLQLTFLNC